MKFLLVVVFNLGGQQMQFAEGFYPLQYNTYQECESKRVEMEVYFQQNSTSFPPYDLACYSREEPGTKS